MGGAGSTMGHDPPITCPCLIGELDNLIIPHKLIFEEEVTKYPLLFSYVSKKFKLIFIFNKCMPLGHVWLISVP